MNAYMNWSGGKDASLSLYKILQSGVYNVTHLLTSVNHAHNRVSMHGVRCSLLKAQAAAIGIPLKTIELPEQPDMNEYEQRMADAVQELKHADCTHSIFGDIFLDDLRAYREQKLSALDIQCVFPLWKINTAELVKEFIALGFKAVVVCVNEQYLDKSFCGRLIDESFVNDLPTNVDPCGENGEYHSFVFEGPVFKEPLHFTKGDIVRREYPAPDSQGSYGFYFCDLV